MKILVAEDDAVARLVLEGTLRTLGHTLLMAADGLEAWDRLSTQPIDIVIGDWIMPGLDGLELCRRIRARGNEYVYYILITNADPTDENENAAMTAGVDDFLVKPIDWRELRHRLRVAERILGYTSRLRELEAMLPVCSYCGKIRITHVEWTEPAPDLLAQSEKILSHGICPECYQKHVVPKLES